MGSAGNISCWSDTHDGSRVAIAMQLNIGNEEAEKLAIALAELKGKTKAEAITRTLQAAESTPSLNATRTGNCLRPPINAVSTQRG